MMLRPIVGVVGDWLVIGSSESAINRCLDTAAGRVKTIADNPRFRREGVVPAGPVTSASFADLSSWGQEAGALLMMFGWGASVMPDEPEVRPIKGILTMLTRLGPVLQEINFYRSTSSVSTWANDAWATKQIVTYQPPPAAKPATAPAATDGGGRHRTSCAGRQDWLPTRCRRT
jgi:hypothetical protein